jgi:4,5-DOPA dioxygenase extradiol
MMKLMSDTLMPVAFLGHGSPMNALERNSYTDVWRSFGASVPHPRAILAISAHWYVNVTAVTAMARPKTIHDFYGFPDELFAVEYPAPGDPGVADEIAEVVKPTWVGLDHDSWGLDHGTWSVLVHAFAEADVPVVQLSINADQPFDYHLELGAKLAPLRERGVLIVGSGNVVHNLRRVDWNMPSGGFDWAHRFDDAARAVMTGTPGAAAELERHPDFRNAAPTPDHFLPLLYIAGLASAAGTTAEVLVDGYAYGSLSMTSYVVGGHTDQLDVTSAAGELPNPAKVPTDETNT